MKKAASAGRTAWIVLGAAVAVGSSAVAEEVLLLLPKDFDAKATGGWARQGGQTTRFKAEDVKDAPVVLRFRGEQVSYSHERVDHHDTGNCWVDIHSGDEYRASFRRGELEGEWTSWQRNYYRGCEGRDDGEYMRVRHDGVLRGQADADGRLEVTVRVTDEEILDRRTEYVKGPKGGRLAFREGFDKRNQAPSLWTFALEFQLPVGQLQSSQQLSASPPRPALPPVSPRSAEPAEAQGSATTADEAADATAGAAAAGAGGPVSRRAGGTLQGESADAVATEAPGTAQPHETVPAAPRESLPATPAETAAATVGSGLLVGIGAWLTARANGAGLRDLLGGFADAFRGEAPPRDPQAALDAPQGASGVPEVPAPPPPDAMGEVASEIAAADARIEARRRRIAERDAEIQRDEAEIRAQEEALGLDPLGASIEEHFVEYQGELSRQGYRLANPGYDAALPLREAVDAGAFLAAQVTPGVKAVRCGDFAEIGVQDLQAELRRRYGDAADRFIVDKVFVDVVRDDSWSGQANAFLDAWLAPKNHVATRVITPDGRRFVLDYWEANRGSGSRMISEEAWVARWRERMGEDMRYFGSDDNAADEKLLENQLVLYQEKQAASPDQALEMFRTAQENKIRRAAVDDAEKARRLKRLETLVRTYERCGRFRSPGT